MQNNKGPTDQIQMIHQEKQVDYETSNSYSTLNQLTMKTKNVWIVFHGIGYLSRFFIKGFDQLSAEENYIIAPQAPSKYYLNNQYKHVGASWLTKEGTTVGIKNIISYTDAVYKNEDIPDHCKLYILGYSQGVSIATRWVVRNKLKCHRLILYAGQVPMEHTTADYGFLIQNKTKVTYLVGDRDEYITEELLESETERLEHLFNGQVDFQRFQGTHEFKKELMSKLV